MAPVEAAFYSTDGRVLEVHDRNQQAKRQWRDGIERLAEKYDASNFWSLFTPDGVRIDGAFLNGVERNDPPEGWRWDVKAKCFKPARRTDRGKEIAADLARHGLLREPYPGMPWYVSADADEPGKGWLLYLRAEQLGGVVWATFSKPRATWRREDHIDESIWQQARLSAYHAAREAVEEHADE